MRKKISTPITYKLLVLLLILIIPLNIASLSVSYMVIQDARSTTRNSIRATLNSYLSRLDERILLSNYLLYSTVEQDADSLSFIPASAKTDYIVSRQKAFLSLTESLSVANAADAAFIYIEKHKEYLTPVKSSSPISASQLKSYLSNIDVSRESLKWHLTYIDEKPYAIKYVFGDHCYYGVIIGIEKYLSELESTIEYKEYVLLPGSINKAEKNYIYISEHCENMDFSLSLGIPKNQLAGSISAIRWTVISVFILYCCLIPVLYYYLRRLVVKPLNKLNNAHAELEAGHQDFRINCQPSTSEFQIAYQSFNNMAESIQHLTLETINKELAYKEMLLNNLQLQIRPHFLLNTFNMVYTLITTHKEHAAQKMILYLSQYFRYLFQYTEDLELFSKEFQLITQYLEVAEIQYPERFTFSSQIDPEVNMVRLPPLLLHNFIENIISHALIPDRTVHIMFVGLYEDGIVSFQIADDGNGMPPEDVEQINHSEYSDLKKGKHVGIRNSISRLKYFYSGSATVNVESQLGEGTTITIMIPYNLENDADDISE